MGNRKKYMSAAFTGVAAAGAVGLATGPAHAATDAGTWHVNPPNTQVSASNSTSPTVLTANGATVLTCGPRHAFLAGTTTSGSTSVLVKAVSGAFSNCTSPATQTYQAAVSQGSLVGSSYNAATGVTTGTFKNVKAKITGPGGCTISLAGSVHGTYTNGTHKLKANPASDLTVTGVNGAPCTVLVGTGEKTGFAGTFGVSPSVTISQ